MFDKYIIDPDSFANVGPENARTGFSFTTKLGYYRGLTLSMLEDLAVSLDGESLPRDAISFDEGNGPIDLDQMETAYDRRWNFGAPAKVTVAYPGGLTAGTHTVSLRQQLRISYMPFPSVRFTEKVIEFP